VFMPVRLERFGDLLKGLPNAGLSFCLQGS
jgi:hypothetical protein